MAIETLIPTQGFLTIHLDSLRVNRVLGFDLYLRKGTEYILYRASSLPFTESNRMTLAENGIDRLYVSKSNLAEYQAYIETTIHDIIADDSIDEAIKAAIVYDSARILVKDLLSKPSLPENVQRSMDFVESTVAFVLNGEKAFYNLLRVMSFDYYTYTHSVNVCTFSLALARHIGITQPQELHRLGTGALLHDVGKTRIDETILNKRGPLSPDERRLIEKHPAWGVEILHETDMISDESYYPVFEHHERENGSGYPKGLQAKGINPYSKIVAITDVFDAMTTRRVYRSAISSFPALKEMFADEGAFDKELLESFTRLMGRGGIADT